MKYALFFRYLCNKNSNVQIYKVRLETPINQPCGKPVLELVTFEHSIKGEQKPI